MGLGIDHFFENFGGQVGVPGGTFYFLTQVYPFL